MVDGSQFTTSEMPSFMAVIKVLVGKTWYKAGVGFQVEEGFFTAAHVIEGALKVEVSRNGKSVVLSPEEFEHVKAGDCVRVPRILTEINISSGKLSQASLDEGQLMMAVCHNGTLSSCGPLKPAAEFGCVNYHGSTTQGFSGSPYYMHKTIFGLHLGAGTVNLGIEAAYIQNCLIKKESSEDYFSNLLRKGAKHRFRRDPHDPDEIVVNIHGKYHRMDADEYQRLIENSMEYEYNEDTGDFEAFKKGGRGRGKKSYTYRDLEKESAAPIPGNGVSPAMAGLAHVSRLTGKAQTLQVIAQPSGSQTLPPTGSLSQASRNLGTTVAHGLTAAPKSVASATMSQDTGNPKKPKSQRTIQEKIQGLDRAQRELDLARERYLKQSMS